MLFSQAYYKKRQQSYQLIRQSQMFAHKMTSQKMKLFALDQKATLK